MSKPDCNRFIHPPVLISLGTFNNTLSYRGETFKQNSMTPTQFNPISYLPFKEMFTMSCVGQIKI